MLLLHLFICCICIHASLASSHSMQNQDKIKDQGSLVNRMNQVMEKLPILVRIAENELYPIDPKQHFEHHPMHSEWGQEIMQLENQLYQNRLSKFDHNEVLEKLDKSILNFKIQVEDLLNPKGRLYNHFRNKSKSTGSLLEFETFIKYLEQELLNILMERSFGCSSYEYDFPSSKRILDKIKEMTRLTNPSSSTYLSILHEVQNLDDSTKQDLKVYANFNLERQLNDLQSKRIILNWLNDLDTASVTVRLANNSPEHKEAYKQSLDRRARRTDQLNAAFDFLHQQSQFLQSAYGIQINKEHSAILELPKTILPESSSVFHKYGLPILLASIILPVSWYALQSNLQNK